MSNSLSYVLNMSMTGSIVILMVLAARFFLRRQPKIFSYALWSAVLFRLLCPVAFTAPISVLNVVEPEIEQSSVITSRVTYIPQAPEFYTDFVTVREESSTLQPVGEETAAEHIVMTPMHIAACIWAAVAAMMLIYSILQYYLLKRKLVGAMLLQENVFLADHIDTAFVLGILHSKIYLPSGVPEKERYYILAHEQHHIRRGDHIIKLLAYLALCIHWFNPLVWLAFVLAGKDMEMSCDEAVIKKLGPEIRADYSASLLRLSTHKKILSGMPLAFGEGDTKGRVLNMAKWKKPAKWVVAICLILCISVVVVCAFNPEEEKTIEELTRRTSDSPVDTGIDELYFTYPAGLTSEQREVENWTRAELRRILNGQRNRGQFDHFFIDNGVDFGGVVDFVVPEDREIRLEELNLPSEWISLDYITGSSDYPYAEMEYTLIKDGKDYIQMYLYTYSGRGYFIWFYTEQGDPAHKQAILESVELGGGSRGKTKTECDEPLSLGRFNLTVPKGYGYYRKETVILEIRKQERFKDMTVVGCVTARPNPDLPMKNEADLTRWIEAVGIDLSTEGIFSEIAEESVYGDISLKIHNLSGLPPMEEEHYLYIAGDIVYDLWIDPANMDERTKTNILESVWIQKAYNIPDGNKWVTAAGSSPVQIGDLPDGYNYGFDGDQNIVFAWGRTAVGGVKSYSIAGIYDPYDSHFFWLEEVGIPDYEDPSLIHIGGMTSGDSGWVAEFASDVPSGTPVSVHRRHEFQVVGEILYDVWFDMLSISRDNRMAISAAVKLPEAPSAEEAEVSQEAMAFEKTLAVMEAVSEGPCHIYACLSNVGHEGPSGYEKHYLFSDGSFLFTNRVLTDGENVTDAGAYFYRYVLLIHNDEWFDNAGSQADPAEIHWSPAEPVDPESPWLGSRAWNRTFATYLGTTSDESGTCYLFRYEKPYGEGEEFDPSYFVNFYFDPQGNFQKAVIQVNMFRDDAFTVTESILSLNPQEINKEIEREYARAAK